MKKESLKETIAILGKEIGKSENYEVQALLADCLLKITKELYEANK